ncbi:hypothetical protein ATANTOWER_009160 [Ataeniobius toweri]|uniref:Secreted protein n=1 Tax=Ataeniobius toweri TaxID=208326 RepID=A0ABU7A5U1_9TELE|nr:hypothetical protein [Ataeniobius toweri]
MFCSDRPSYYAGQSCHIHRSVCRLVFVCVCLPPLIAGCGRQVQPHSWSSSSPIRRRGFPEADGRLFCSMSGNQFSHLHSALGFQCSASLLSEFIGKLTSRVTL